jgi:hypothetical protein
MRDSWLYPRMEGPKTCLSSLEPSYFNLGFVYRMLSQLRGRKYLCQTISSFPSCMLCRPLKREQLGVEPVTGSRQAK